MPKQMAASDETITTAGRPLIVSSRRSQQVQDAPERVHLGNLGIGNDGWVRRRPSIPSGAGALRQLLQLNSTRPPGLPAPSS